MTKIEELEQKLNDASSGFEFVINEIRKELVCYKTQKELKESKKEGKWKPKPAEEYWFRNTDKGEIESICRYEGDCWDDWRINNIPIFKTEEECERYWRFMDTVKEKSYSFSEEEWEDDEVDKLVIYYDYTRKEFGVTCTWVCKYLGEIYFKNEADAKYIIDNFKEELLEYWYKGEMKNET